MVFLICSMQNSENFYQSEFTFTALVQAVRHTSHSLRRNSHEKAVTGDISKNQDPAFSDDFSIDHIMTFTL